jgi:gamma-glutamyltranspeptidase / glutathione hydrolase
MQRTAYLRFGVNTESDYNPFSWKIKKLPPSQKLPRPRRFCYSAVMQKRPFGPLLILVTFLLHICTPGLILAAAADPVRAKHAMVASQHELASKVGAEIMKKGGNAVDAAIAVGLTLAVVYPEAGNIGGGGFMLIRLPNGEVHAIDYRETAPGTANRNMYADASGKTVIGDGSSTVGYSASGVPGTLAGFEMAFRKYGSGKLRWRDLVEPARTLASRGYALSHRVTELFQTYKGTLARYGDSKKIFLNKGSGFGEGDILRQPELAATLLRIERGGAADFYAGHTARLIADDMKAHGGWITLDDLRAYRAKERKPLRGSYRGFEVISLPPPSSGGIVMLEVLNMLEGYDIKPLQYNSAEKYHMVAESMRRAFADRAEFMGDSDFTTVPVDELISKPYAVKRRAGIRIDRASNSSDVSHGSITGREPTETTNFAVVDAAGTVVVNTYTINDLFGSRVTIKGTGVLMNDEMDDFATRPGQPNMFGLIQGEKNAIEAGKRPLSSMTPAIVFRKDGSFWFGVGARGGPRIISAVIQTISNVVDHDMDIQAAIDAPRIHHQWLPDELVYEPYGFSPDTLEILRKFGHRFVGKPDKVAAATGVMIDKSGVRLGAVDSRSDGAAIGY